jgi:uncharacterized DUF497 family protein
MRIDGFIWLDAIVEKLAVKHQVEPEEVEEALRNRPKFRFVEKGKHEGEDVYMALSQTEEGRYLTTLFIYKPAMAEQKTADALILSARDMAEKERKLYGKK